MTTRKQFLVDNKSNYTKTLRPIRGSKKSYPLMTMAEKYKFKEIYNIGYLDIETSSLHGDFGVMWSYAILIRNTQTNKIKLRYGVVNENDFKEARRKGHFKYVDKRIVEKLIQDISDCDALIGHWFIGKKRHDIPYVRTRCAINKISGFPKYKMIKYGDTHKWGSTIHRLSRYSLDSVARAYGSIIEKTPVSQDQWMDMYICKPSAVRYVKDHNIKDVKLNHFIHLKMEEYVPEANIYF